MSKTLSQKLKTTVIKKGLTKPQQITVDGVVRCNELVHMYQDYKQEHYEMYEPELSSGGGTHL